MLKGTARWCRQLAQHSINRWWIRTYYSSHRGHFFADIAISVIPCPVLRCSRHHWHFFSLADDHCTCIWSIPYKCFRILIEKLWAFKWIDLYSQSNMVALFYTSLYQNRSSQFFLTRRICHYKIPLEKQGYLNVNTCSINFGLFLIWSWAPVPEPWDDARASIVDWTVESRFPRMENLSEKK